MATFQSQINILAAANHNIHKKISDLEQRQLKVEYSVNKTIIKDNKDDTFITINNLGYNAYDAIVVMNNNEAYLFGYDGEYRKLLLVSNSGNNGIEYFLKFEYNSDWMEVNNDFTITIKKTTEILKNITVYYRENYEITNIELYFSDNTINQGTRLHLESKIGSENKHILIVHSKQAKANGEDETITYCSIQITKLIELDDDLAEKYKNIKIIDITNPLQNDIGGGTEGI